MSSTRVAERAGVGVMTVSRALKSPPSVSAPLRARVEAAVAALGYVPDRFAGGLASAGTRLVTVIVPSLSRRVFSDIVQGADAVLRPRGFQILFSNTFYSLEQEEETCRAVLGWRPEGVIIAGVDHTAGTRRLLADAGVSVVEAMELGEHPIDLNVGLSHHDAGRCMAEHLIARGYRRIGFVGTQLDADFRAARRRAGFLRALAGHGLACAAQDSGDAPASFRVGAEAMARLLERRAPVDALFCVNDELAVGAILECLRRGVQVPGDVAIAGFNGLEIGAELVPSLTTVISPRHRIGELSARAIVDRIDGCEPASRCIDVGFAIASRESA